MINILYLYHDIMNLYGENGNVRAITHELERNKIKVKVDYKSINDRINFMKYDIVYIGCGSDESLELVNDDFIKRKDKIKEYIEKNKYLFATGNSIALFGDKIKTNEREIRCSNIFDYNCEYLTKNEFKNASNKRIVGETISECKQIKEKIIGFQNRGLKLLNTKKHFLKTDTKYSNDLISNNEGFIYRNFYSTFNIGPLFIRNPYLLDYFLQKICSEKKIKFDIEENSYSKEAYKKYLDLN